MHRRVTPLVSVMVLALGVQSAQAQTAPNAPENFNVVSAGNLVTFTWSAPSTGPEPTGYELEIVPTLTLGYKLDAGLTYEVTQTLPDDRYTARVRGYNGSVFGPPSTDFSFTVAPMPPPRNFSVSVAPGSNLVTFFWDPPISGPPSIAYVLESGIPGQENIPGWEEVIPRDALNWTTSFPNGVFVARLRGAGETGLGLTTPDVAFIVGPPPTGPVPFPPSGLRAEVIGHSVTLHWNLREDSPPASSFVIVAQSSLTGDLLAVIDTASAARQATFRDVPTGGYTVSVYARNAHGLSQRPSESIHVGVNVASCGTQLDPPTGLSYTQSGNFVALTWARPAIAAQLTAYLIEVTGTIATTFSTGNQSTYIAGYIPSGTYSVQVRAHNSCRASDPTNQVTIVVP